MSDLAKNMKIRETYAATMQRRKSQHVCVVTVKVQENKLNRQQAQQLKMCFVEAKWLRNYVLSLSNEGKTDIFKLDYTDFKEVVHYDKDKNEIHSKLENLSAQMKQDVITDIRNNIKGLAKAKAKGLEVGNLKFVSEYTAINLKQAGCTHKIVGKNKIKIQGIKKPLKVNGLDQIEKRFKSYELANAKLILKPSGYYIALTLMIPNEESLIIEKKETIGIDMGCETSFTLSNGDKQFFYVEESERTKKLQRKLERTQKGSNNRWKVIKQLRKAYEKDSNRKDDAAKKYCSKLKDKQVIIQDEQLANWQQLGHGKKVQHSIMGRVKSRLINDGAIVLSKWIPTTKFCNKCGNKIDITQEERTFVCPHCGHTEDRDIHAAKNMIWFYENIVGVERTEYSPAAFKDTLNKLFDAQEAAKSLA